MMEIRSQTELPSLPLIPNWIKNRNSQTITQPHKEICIEVGMGTWYIRAFQLHMIYLDRRGVLFEMRSFCGGRLTPEEGP